MFGDGQNLRNFVSVIILKIVQTGTGPKFSNDFEHGAQLLTVCRVLFLVWQAPADQVWANRGREVMVWCRELKPAMIGADAKNTTKNGKNSFLR